MYLVYNLTSMGIMEHLQWSIERNLSMLLEYHDRGLVGISNGVLKDIYALNAIRIASDTTL